MPAMWFSIDMFLPLSGSDRDGTGGTSDKLAGDNSTRRRRFGRIFAMLPGPNMRGVGGGGRAYDDAYLTEEDVMLSQARCVVATASIENVGTKVRADQWWRHGGGRILEYEAYKKL